MERERARQGRRPTRRPSEAGEGGRANWRRHRGGRAAAVLPALAGGCSAAAARAAAKEEGTDDFRTLLSHGVKQGGINFRNPVESAARMRQSSVEGSRVLVASLLSGKELNGVEHATSVRAASTAGRKERVEQEQAHILRSGRRRPGILNSKAY